MSRRSERTLSCLIAASAGSLQPAMAQSFPERLITLIVPFPAGGPTDAIGRVIAESLAAKLGKPIVIENIGGATGSVGTARVARASPDGYTLGLGNIATHVFNGAAFSLKYDIAKDFQPISLVASEAQIIVSSPTVPARDLQQLISWIRGKQGIATAGTAGSGSVAHISGVKFQQLTGTQLVFVSYKGLGPAMQDLLGGHVDLMLALSGNSMSQLQAGAIKGYAVTSRTRLAAVPDIPTVDEAGLPGFYFSNWHALWAPASTPQSIIGKLSTATSDALSDPSVRKRMEDLGQQVPAESERGPDQLASHQKSEIAIWWPAVTATHSAPSR